MHLVPFVVNYAKPGEACFYVTQLKMINLRGFIPLNMILLIDHELTSRSLWSNSETWPPWEGGGQTHNQQATKTRSDMEQSNYVARCGQLPAKVLPTLPTAHPRPVAARKCGSPLCSFLSIFISSLTFMRSTYAVWPQIINDYEHFVNPVKVGQTI